MFKTIFKISKMDCASEEQLIRMKLDGRNEIKNLDFDIPNRKLTIVHTGESNEINNLLRELNLGSELVSNTETDEPVNIIQTNKKERKMLWTVLIINISFFVIEIITGFITNSMGLVADSLDMLADGIVYGLALLAVGGTVARKKNIAKFAGYFQIVLALIGFTEVVRRFIGIEKMPDFQTMIIVSIFALIANVICLFLLQKGKSKEAHMQASMIFTSNDVIINTGVITAGLLVNWLNSSYPDLIIGAIVFIIVARGAYRILQLAK
ncbi:cation transporter [Echinicola rosea]|uniref:Transporter n=1 Tax=Echinicola rosea TaxID=1807691 RepID=A0ABQ1VAI0_9BACT|nr:cation diffusion facilitator family transporter [Echinicola rosea]MCB0495934.1 cation transporter [Cyclobacteriaceae bacterium]MCW5903013.1 cation transporter [Cyclobacteriaceae bacterium]GGF43644.1 transporter [Echinicola rosea]